MPTHFINVRRRGGGTSGSRPVFTSGPPPAGVAGTPYAFTFTASGSPTFGVAGGTLPPGLSLSPAGVLSGTPSTTGTYGFSVVASNGYGSAVAGPYTVQVSTAPVSSGLLVGASTGSGGPDLTATRLGTRIQRFYEQAGEMPANWAARSGSRAAAGNVVATSIKPDINTLAAGSGSAYNTLVSRLIAMNNGRPDRPGEREAMWHEPYGDSFSAATWRAASINFYNDVIRPTNLTRTHPILYYINLQGSTIASGAWSDYFTPEVMANCDEVTFDCYQVVAQDNAAAVAADAGKPLGIPEYGFRTGITHTDAEIRAYMEENVPRLLTLDNLAWVAWFNGGTNSIVGVNYTQSCAYWKSFADSVHGV